jgi:hypothetical protein
MLASTAMLQALGYCTPDEPSVWPPDQATIGTLPELTVTWRDSEGLWIRADGQRIELERVWAGDGQVALRPRRALPAGPVELVGWSAPVRWTVTEVATEPPRWRAEPSVDAVVGFGFICPPGPFVSLTVPLIGARRQPLVELTATLPDGSRFRRRFVLVDDAVSLHDGCSLPWDMQQGSTVPLVLVGIDEQGRRTEPRDLVLPLVEGQ